MSWIAAPFPRKQLKRDTRVVALTDRERLLLHTLYDEACDRHGLFDASEMMLRLETRMVMGPRLQKALVRLAAVGLVHLYLADGRALSDGPVEFAMLRKLGPGTVFGELVEYEERLTQRLKEGRSPSEHPTPDRRRTSSETSVQTDAERQSRLTPDVSPKRRRTSVQTDVERQSEPTPEPTPDVSSTPAEPEPLRPLSPPHTPPLSPTSPPGGERESHARPRVSAPPPAREETSGGEADRAAPEPGPSWPSEAHRQAAERFIAAAVAHAKTPGAVRPEGLAELARQYPADFVAGVEQACEAGPTWGGWSARVPYGWLATECKRVQSAQPTRRSTASRPRPRAPADVSPDRRPTSVRTDARGDVLAELVARVSPRNPPAESPWRLIQARIRGAGSADPFELAARIDGEVLETLERGLDGDDDGRAELERVVTQRLNGFGAHASPQAVADRRAFERARALRERAGAPELMSLLLEGGDERMTA